ncbi:N-alpha-acetyltransferase 38-B [Escovopsis weberi]|uniref:N-alpha-acetyltransferase 38-B n=1 Tax=Escovopsis weberi TaxID=150374 RepID=A0A0M8MTZ2_ESCWE|nr:N-alpha-acetyltransferase 38-B [Escovopsis weberi]
MVTGEAQEYISSLLNQNLRVHTTDGRIFWGAFKCTDSDRNIVLANTYECRFPPAPAERTAATADDAEGNETSEREMASRYLGLIVVPGEHIVKLEVEQFASQMKNRRGVA